MGSSVGLESTDYEILTLDAAHLTTGCEARGRFWTVLGLISLD